MNRTKQHFVQRSHELFSTVEPFRQFLMAQPPDAVVGVSRSSRCCPIAMFAKSEGFPVDGLTDGHLDIAIGEKVMPVLGVNKDGWEESGTLSLEDACWFPDFVRLVDRLHEKGTEISARRALRLLDTLRVSNVYPGEIEESDLIEEEE